MLSRSLAPLEPIKSKINVINGLFNQPAVGIGIHPGQTGNILSGMPLMKGAVLRGGISMDQVLANSIGQEAMQPTYKWAKGRVGQEVLDLLAKELDVKMN